MSGIQPHIAHHIVLLRDQRVMLDSDLAVLYGVETKVLVQAVKRNIERFPADFMFQLSKEEWVALRSQTVTSNPNTHNRGGRRYELQDKTELLALSHDTFSRNTRNQLKRVFDSLRELMTPPAPQAPPQRPIGFIPPQD